jgi:hypothetical protein
MITVHKKMVLYKKKRYILYTFKYKNCSIFVKILNKNDNFK